MKMVDKFILWKEENRKSIDLSRKGAIDAPIIDLVNEINFSDRYFTTSSCSGRIILFEQKDSGLKKGCRWLFVSHVRVTPEAVLKSLLDATSEAVLKFEPFIIHIQCQHLDDARLVHCVAVASGFRNSGITVGKHGKTICAVRSTHSLEVPLSCDGRLIVSEEYITFLVQRANEKMDENLRRIQRFRQNLSRALSEPGKSDEPSSSRRGRDHHLHHQRHQSAKPPSPEVTNDSGGSKSMDNNFDELESLTRMFEET